MIRLFKIWLRIASRVAQAQLINNWAGLLFLLGKIVRFLLFFIFLYTVLSQAQKLGDFNRDQVIIFFLVFNLVDILAQFFFRGVYVFRPLVVSGDFDLDLLKPWPSFFRPLFGWTDVVDLTVLIPLWGYFFFFLSQSGYLNLNYLLLFFGLLFNSLLIAFAFHLFVSSMCLLTTEIDHLVAVYRDLARMAIFPTDIYAQGIRFLLTFTIPIVVLITVPAKAMLGIISLPVVVLSLMAGIILSFASLRFWRYSLKKYSSASS